MLSYYTKICDGIVLLMQPLVEVVIHDLKTGKICYINGNISKRKIGDSSLLKSNVKLEENLDQITYPKINFNGKLVKSVSIPIENEWLICINADLSLFYQMQNLSENFLKSPVKDRPSSLFKNDWQEKLHVTIADYLHENCLKFEELSLVQKKALTKHLFIQGAFEEKNAANYIARLLGLGRATIFNYLKEWRNNPIK